jgi:hypothetical protein
MKEIMQNTLGRDYQIRVRKVTLLQFLHVMGRSRSKRRRLKKNIIRQVTRVVNWLRNVSIKTQRFIQFYVLHKLAQGQDLLPSVFTANCIYGFM